ncbi:interferon-inducible GTPase 5-like [Hypanus sabinus]|uniref:interferon-inducible GTPase 5-like n=1 Tax=Hypanus sabinus TaxID=79690 RepID=UPI0028C415E7|nr:interferon-inducible GTPase 5-like [Hypanus sabinus]XP_059841465.1 interferon-inducible GTPase 5-like [Hypanus sabinus]
MAGVLSNLYYSTKDVKDLVAAYQREGDAGLQLAINEKSKQFENVRIKIAVMGESGSGKSTLINALLELDEERAAPTGGKETTTEITPYAHPTLPNVQYDDFPGFNTPKFPVKEFMKKTNFSQYDLGIIVTAARFTENDKLLAEALKKAGKPFYLVRSKIDDTIRAESRKKGYNQEDMFQDLRKYCISSLELAGVKNTPVFLCSAFDLDQFDFPKLREAVVSNLSETQKNLFITALPNTSEEAIERKCQALRPFIQMLSAVSGSIGVVPIPGLSLACDLALIITGILYIRMTLGLDEASLSKLAQRVGISVEDLKKGTEHNWVFGEITREQVVLLMQRSTVAMVLTIAEPFLDFVPIIGSIFGATSSFGVTLMMLNSSLDAMVETAKIVLQNAKAAASPEGCYQSARLTLPQRDITPS